MRRSRRIHRRGEVTAPVRLSRSGKLVVAYVFKAPRLGAINKPAIIIVRPLRKRGMASGADETDNGEGLDHGRLRLK